MTLIQDQDGHQHTEAVAAQQANALRIANTRRRDLKTLREGLSGGHLSLRDVLLPEPRATIYKMYAVDLIKLTPKFTDITATRVGRRAAEAGVNLLVPCAAMPLAERRWLVEMMEGGVAPRSREKVKVSSVQVAAQLGLAHRQIASLEAKLKRLEGANGVLEQQSLNRQFSFVTGEANERLASLADAVETHRRCVVDQSLPAEKWARADETLWEMKNRILAPLWFPGEEAA